MGKDKKEKSTAVSTDMIAPQKTTPALDTSNWPLLLKVIFYPLIS